MVDVRQSHVIKDLLSISVLSLALGPLMFLILSIHLGSFLAML